MVTDSDVTLAVLASKLDDIREDIRDLKAETITRGEYHERNMRINDQFDSQQQQIVRIKTQLTASRAPWWTYATVTMAGGALAWTIVGPAIIGG